MTPSSTTGIWCVIKDFLLSDLSTSRTRRIRQTRRWPERIRPSRKTRRRLRLHASRSPRRRASTSSWSGRRLEASTASASSKTRARGSQHRRSRGRRTTMTWRSRWRTTRTSMCLSFAVICRQSAMKPSWEHSSHSEWSCFVTAHSELTSDTPGSPALPSFPLRRLCRRLIRNQTPGLRVSGRRSRHESRRRPLSSL